jgi:hypothetical protein
MSKYLLSVHSADGESRAPMTEAEMRQLPEKIRLLEEDMNGVGALLFSGRLSDADAAAVVRHDNGEVITTDGPFVEAKEHIAGFYIIQADDLEAALAWAARTTEAVGAPIEVRPFWEPPASAAAG